MYSHAAGSYRWILDAGAPVYIPADHYAGMKKRNFLFSSSNSYNSHQKDSSAHVLILQHKRNSSKTCVKQMYNY